MKSCEPPERTQICLPYMVINVFVLISERNVYQCQSISALKTKLTILYRNKMLCIPVDAHFKAWVCSSSGAGVAGPSLAGGMDCCFL